MRRIRLSSLIYKNFMTAALVPILFIELALIVLYFSINSYVSTQISSSFINHSKETINSIVDREVSVVNTKLKEIERQAILLQNEHEALFASIDQIAYEYDESKYAMHSNGAFYSVKHTGGSSMYYSSDTVIGDTERNKIAATEMMDTSFKSLVNNNDLISQVYFNSADNMNRIYPFIDNSPAQYGPLLNMSDYNFYYLADREHNPSESPVWTSVYLDPAGMGWLMSCIVPVYVDGRLEGVTGIDITVESMIANTLDLNLPNRAKAFMVDDSGMILAMGPEIERLLRLTELKEHAYVETIEKTIYKPEEFNLYKHPDEKVRHNLSAVFRNSMESSEVTINNELYYVVHQSVPQTGWHLFVVAEMSEIIHPIIVLKEMSFNIGAAAVLVMVLFYLFFFMYFKRRSGQLSHMISHPIVSLSENTKYVGTEFFSYDFDESGIEEIQQLNQNFEEMTTELESRTKELIRAEVDKLEKEQEAEKLLLISVTDPLTGLYNRLKIDEILDYEIEQTERYEKNLSVLMGDIDHFKRVNDNYGHQAGDEVLKLFAHILQENTRGSDTVARWGGEEFLVVFTSTCVDEAFDIAEKLRVIIEKTNFPYAGRVTASFGVSQFISGESKEALIKRADEALYEAKALSRNVVIKK